MHQYIAILVLFISFLIMNLYPQ